MKLPHTLYTTLIGLIILLNACKDFIEPSLENIKVTLVAPGDKLETTSYRQTFWWEPVEDALSYRLQIVTPKFDSVPRMIMDTLINGNKSSFALTLDPGKYQWRLRAENGSSKTLYSTSSFAIHQTSIKAQQVQLQSPGNRFLTNQGAVTYKWEALFGATRYRFQLDTDNFPDEDGLIYNQTTPSLEFPAVSFKNIEKQYQWRVRAENDTAQSKWSAIYNITFDKTPPPIVVLRSPENNTSISKVSTGVSLQWYDSNDATKYELTVLSDLTTVYPTFPVTVTGMSYDFKGGAIGEKFYWKVKAVDEAGNKSDFSEVWNFTLKQ